MNRRSQNQWGPAALALCLAALCLAGCSGHVKQTVSYDKAGTSYWGEEGQPRPTATRNVRTATQSPQPSEPAPAGQVCSNLYYPTGDKASSALWLQKCVPAEVSVGQTFVSEIRVTNLTGMTLTDVVVNEQLPEGYELASADPVASGAEGATQWRFARLEPLSTKTIRLTGKATKVGALTNCASVAYNTVLCVETRVVQPALALTKTLPAEALTCDPIRMTLRVTNSGSGTARDVRITDNLPEGLTTRDGGKTWSQNVGTLAGGQSKDYTIELRAAGPGTYANTATATAAGGLMAQAEASIVLKKPVLRIVQECPKLVFINRDICHDITVSNTGDGVARNTVLVVSLPQGAAFASATNDGSSASGKVTWNLGDIAPGASKKVSVCARAGQKGLYKLGAAAQADCADAVATSCETSVEGIPAILLEVIDLVDPVAIGANTTYLITATNQGSAVGKNVKIVVNLEENAEFVTSEGSATKGAAEGRTITFEALSDLAVNAKATWKVVVKAAKPGDVRFKVTMNEDQLGRPVEETEATNFYESR